MGFIRPFPALPGQVPDLQQLLHMLIRSMGIISARTMAPHVEYQKHKAKKFILVGGT